VGPNIQHWRKQKELLKRANSTQKAFCRPKHGNFNATDEKFLEYVLEKCPVTRETIQMKALEIAISLKISQQDFKASSGWGVRFMNFKGLAHCRRTRLAQKFPADYTEKINSIQRHIINMCHDYLLGQIGNTHETQKKPQSFLYASQHYR
jgi:glutathionyl-hydroquinone reductase